MPGLVPGIHAFMHDGFKGVDGRPPGTSSRGSPGHDGNVDHVAWNVL
jgi:hypothetical protein